MTVMLLVVVVYLFNTIIVNDSTGTKARIEAQGSAANLAISTLQP
jgi:hypothetical protein